MNKITIGDVEILALTDGAGLKLKLDETFPTVRARVGAGEEWMRSGGPCGRPWETYYQRYPQVFGDASTWYLHYGCYLVRTQDCTVLVDTGVGPGPYMGVVYGRLPDVLREHEVDPEEVDVVFLTHAHADHVGWNFTAEGTPRFPKARYVLHQDEWDFFQQPMVKMSIASYVDQLLTPLKRLGVLDLLPDGRTLTPELTAIPTPGHSPGHMSLLIASKGQKGLIGGDAIIHPAQVSEPTWCSVFDMDNEPTIATRKRLLDMLEREEIILAAGHFPSPGFGRIICEGGRRYWQALA